MQKYGFEFENKTFFIHNDVKDNVTEVIEPKLGVIEPDFASFLEASREDKEGQYFVIVPKIN